MAMSEERMAILRMIEGGAISAEEGTRLLAAMGEDSDDDVPTQAVESIGSSGRAIQIRVTDLNTNRQKVNVNIPASLARLALRFIPKDTNVHLETIEAALDAGVNERIMEVVDNEHNTRVEILVV